MIGKRKDDRTLEAARAELQQLKAERAETASALPTREELVERLDAAIKHHAEQYEPGIGALVEGAHPGRLLGRAAYNADVIKATLAYFTPALLRAPYIAAIDKLYRDTAPGLPAAARRARLAELDVAILETGISEERAVAAAEAEGREVARRPDLDPQAFFAAHGEAAADKLRALELAARQANLMVQDLSDRRRDVLGQRNWLHSQALDRPPSEPGLDERIADGPRRGRWMKGELKQFDELTAELERVVRELADAEARWSALNAPLAAIREYGEAKGLLPQPGTARAGTALPAGAQAVQRAG